MDWTLAIEKNREALKRILAMLAAMVEVAGDGVDRRAGGAPTLPRHLHRFLLRLLRPAEAATRRLIIVAARGMVVELSPPRTPKPKPKSIFVRDGVGTGIVRQGSIPDPALVPPRALSLPLLDPLKRGGGRRRPKQHSVPRISFFDRPRDPDPPPSTPEDPLDAGRLHRRLQAIARALDDLPRQATRLARWQARARAHSRNSDAGRDAEGAQERESRALGKDRIRRLSPMRPGRPPGWRRQPTHAVHEVLNELHGLAVWTRERPDTS